MVKRHAPVGRIFVAAWVALVVGGSVLAFAARGAGLLPGDLALTRSLQKLPPDSALGTLLSYAGEVVWFLAIAALAVALLMSRWLAALFILLASLTSVFIGEALKLLVASPRPSAELVRVVDPQQGHGFPSSTALLSVVLLGMIVYLIWQPRRSVAVVAMGISPLMVLLIGLSRVYVGEHWATDVVGGWLFGDAWLLVLVAAHRWWVFRRAKS
jgi:membrane-associated phospholipid phosphatase